jgi:hypothetical protein
VLHCWSIVLQILAIGKTNGKLGITSSTDANTYGYHHIKCKTRLSQAGLDISQGTEANGRGAFLIGLVPSKIPFTFSICQGHAEMALKMCALQFSYTCTYILI